MTLGTPGGDSQPQSCLQVFTNIVDFGLNVQEAVEAPRFCGSSFSPLAPSRLPERLQVEARLCRQSASAEVTRSEVVGPWGVGIYPHSREPETGCTAAACPAKNGHARLVTRVGRIYTHDDAHQSQENRCRHPFPAASRYGGATAIPADTTTKRRSICCCGMLASSRTPTPDAVASGLPQPASASPGAAMAPLLQRRDRLAVLLAMGSHKTGLGSCLRPASICKC